MAKIIFLEEKNEKVIVQVESEHQKQIKAYAQNIKTLTEFFGATANIKENNIEIAGSNERLTIIKDALRKHNNKQED